MLHDWTNSYFPENIIYYNNADKSIEFINYVMVIDIVIIKNITKGDYSYESFWY